jgi:HD-GYP domain-containing protein (c-di-GMP phosphodiesterase class II)
MRRIVVFAAQPGMILHAPLTVTNGGPALASGHVLTEADLAMLRESPGTMIEVEDALAAYARELPIFPAPAEGATLQALNTLIMMHPGLEQPVSVTSVQKLVSAIDAMIDGADADMQGTMDLAGPDSLQGHDYIHPVKTMEICIVLARALRLPRSEVSAIATAAALMNIGYAALRRSLLDEPRGLEEHEWRHHVEKHPEYSVRILAEAGLGDGAIQSIADHHERWDGSGYPRGISGADIPLAARIIAVADTYVSLRSRRAYRNALPHDEAIALLADGAGEAFDPDIVRTFTEVAARLAGGTASARATSAQFSSSSVAEDDAAAARRREPQPDALEHARVARDDAPADDLPVPDRPPARPRANPARESTRPSESAPARQAPVTERARIRHAATTVSARSRPTPPARPPRRHAPRSLWAARFYLETRV